jgi:hypothetical protein
LNLRRNLSSTDCQRSPTYNTDRVHKCHRSVGPTGSPHNYRPVGPSHNSHNKQQNTTKLQVRRTFPHLISTQLQVRRTCRQNLSETTLLTSTYNDHHAQRSVQPDDTVPQLTTNENDTTHILRIRSTRYSHNKTNQSPILERRLYIPRHRKVPPQRKVLDVTQWNGTPPYLEARTHIPSKRVCIPHAKATPTNRITENNHTASPLLPAADLLHKTLEPPTTGFAHTMRMSVKFHTPQSPKNDIITSTITLRKTTGPSDLPATHASIKHHKATGPSDLPILFISTQNYRSVGSLTSTDINAHLQPVEMDR